MLVCDDSLVDLQSQLAGELRIVVEPDSIPDDVRGKFSAVHGGDALRNPVGALNTGRPIVVHHLDAAILGEQVHHVTAIGIKEPSKEPVPAHDPGGVKSTVGKSLGKLV